MFHSTLQNGHIVAEFPQISTIKIVSSERPPPEKSKYFFLDAVNVSVTSKRKALFRCKPGYLLIFFLLSFLLFPATSYANLDLVFHGLSQTLSSVFALPAQLMQGGAQAFPLGLVSGAISGSMQAVGGTLAGAINMARGAAPYAKYMIFLL